MTEIMEGFQLPSETAITYDKTPAIAQLVGRLLVVRGHSMVKVKDNSETSKTFGQLIDKLQAEVTFLDGPAIGVLLDKHNQVKEQLDPPMGPGETRKMLVGGWFKTRLEKHIGNPGYPGIVGVLRSTPLQGGRTMWELTDPTPEQMQAANNWLKWRRAEDAKRAAETPAWQTQEQPQQTAPSTPAPASNPAASTAPATAPWAAQQAATTAPATPPAAKPPWEQ